MIDKNTFKTMVEGLLKEVGYYNDLEKLSKEEKEKISSFKENFLNENFDLLSHVNGAATMINNKNENSTANKEENKNINNNNDVKNINENINISDNLNSNINNTNDEPIKNENNP